VEKDKWSKIRIREKTVEVEKEFYMDYKHGSAIYLNNKNDLICEFKGEKCYIHQIKNDQ